MRLILYPVRIKIHMITLKNKSARNSKPRSDDESLIGRIKATIPKTNKILKMLLPTIFPTLILGTFLKEADREATNSGKDVPIAKTVIPIIQGLIPKIAANLAPDLTIK